MTDVASRPYELGSDLQVVQPYEHVLAFYDGRVPGQRVHSDKPNWLDNGAFGLGTAAFAIVDGTSAIVYDTHMSIPHAQRMRRILEQRGIADLRVVLSHWHPDHVAGNAVFEDCEIIANHETARLLEENRDALENGEPPIQPLVMPNRVFEEELSLTVGELTVHLRRFDIHSIDETVILLPEHRTILAGDTLEDTVTYVTEPDRLDHHLEDLRRLAGWDFDTILPNHGTLEKIASNGYDRGFITATELYVRKLIALRDHPEWVDQDLRTFAADALATGAIEYFEPYEWVHRSNVQAVLGA
jgi:cyclase